MRSDALGREQTTARILLQGPKLADCDFNLAALHPAYPIKCRTSTQRTQAPESVDTRRASALDPLENNIRRLETSLKRLKCANRGHLVGRGKSAQSPRCRLSGGPCEPAGTVTRRSSAEGGRLHDERTALGMRPFDPQVPNYEHQLRPFPRGGAVFAGSLCYFVFRRAAP